MAGRPSNGVGCLVHTTRRAHAIGRTLVSSLLVVMLSGWIAAAGYGAAGGGHSARTAPLGGVNIPPIAGAASFAGVDREIAVAHALHAKVVRVEVRWSELEPFGPNQLDPNALAVADRLTSDATAVGIKVIAMVESSPCWASSAPAPLIGRCVPGGSSKANGFPPSNPADYAAFVAYIAQRYGTRLAAIEVWNEPDQANQAYFGGPEKPQRYAAVLRAAYTAIKQANPNVSVLGGSIVGVNGVFLRALYAAGIKGYYDGLSVHFYTLTRAALRVTHEIQLQNGDKTPMWLDEFGWSSCYPKYKTQQEQACVTSHVQARNVSDSFRSLARTPYVAAAALYDLRGSVPENFGLLNANGTHKPAFGAFSRAMRSPFGPISPVSLSLRASRGRVLASGSGPVGNYLELEAFQGSRLRYRSIFSLDRFDRYSLQLPSVLGKSGLRVRVYQYQTPPGSGANRSI